MTTNLAGSMARDHVDSLVAAAAASRQAKEARRARRDQRAASKFATSGRTHQHAADRLGH